MSTATVPTVIVAPWDVQWPRTRPDYRILESVSGHLCGSFLQQEEEVDPHSHPRFADWKCRHDAVVGHGEVDQAAERARLTLERLGLR